MFTLSDIRAEFDRLDAISGLNTKNVKIRISTRMTRTLGVCRSLKRKQKSEAARKNKRKFY